MFDEKPEAIRYKGDFNFSENELIELVDDIQGRAYDRQNDIVWTLYREIFSLNGDDIKRYHTTLRYEIEHMVLMEIEKMLSDIIVTKDEESKSLMSIINDYKNLFEQRFVLLDIQKD